MRSCVFSSILYVAGPYYKRHTHGAQKNYKKSPEKGKKNVNNVDVERHHSNKISEKYIKKLVR